MLDLQLTANSARTLPTSWVASDLQLIAIQFTNRKSRIVLPLEALPAGLPLIIFHYHGLEKSDLQSTANGHPAHARTEAA
jgi:hypothetical protein